MSAFGDYVFTKRTEKHFTLRGFAKAVELAPSYISDIEKGNRCPNERGMLDKMVRVLELDGDAADKLYDLAADQKKGDIPQDVAAYIAENNLARVALRKAKSRNMSNTDWQEVIKNIEK